MTISDTNYSEFLEGVANEIDIAPEKYHDAVRRYQAVGRWLEGGDFPGSAGELNIYPQGSFRLGTVTRPIRSGIETSYDIDLVCEVPLRKVQTTAQAVKFMVGARLREHETYKRLLDPEGRRCWTLEYAEQDGAGFHLDVLPAVPNPQGPLDTEIAITDRAAGSYSWSSSNPRGYASWFEAKNAVAFQRVVAEQKQRIQVSSQTVFESVDDVPDQLIRTPLQRSIQLMKRHRDIHFNHRDEVDYAPISIIITTLAAHLYGNELDAPSALSTIITKLSGHASLVEGRAIDPTLTMMGLIRRRPDGTWYIGNPVDPDENFADRWHEDNHARARAFFTWVDAIQRDVLTLPRETSPRLLKERLGAALGAAEVTKHFDMLVSPAANIDTPPRVHISSAPKPWRGE